MPKDANLTLLQSLGTKDTLSPSAGVTIFFTYFNDVWPWVIGVAASIAVLHALAAGVQIMFAGSSEKAAEGKGRLLWSLAGLLLVIFAGFILRLLNNTFYV